MGTDFVAGEPVSSSIMGTLDLDAPGTYYLILQLAAYGVAPDVDNLNDTIAIFEFDVTGEEQSPDLQITSIGTRPPSQPTARPTHQPIPSMCVCACARVCVRAQI